MSERNSGQSIVLDRRDNYRKDLPEVEQATYLYRSEDAVRVAMIEAGESRHRAAAQRTPATNPALDFAYPNSETVYLRIDHMVPPLDDIRVREALNLAINREAFLGTLKPADTEIATHVVPPSTLG